MRWEDVNKEILEKLFYEDNMADKLIASQYHVTINQVRYKRKKFGISIENIPCYEMRKEKGDLFEFLNENSRQKLCSESEINQLAKALAYYIFCIGPVENMQADGKLNQEDMKNLNQFMVNRLAGILSALLEGKWLKLDLLLGYYNIFDEIWDTVMPDKQELDELFQLLVEKSKEL